MKNKFIFLLLGLMLISFASAFEFDNIKKYNDQTRTATFKNSFLGIPTSEIATVTLISSINNRVGLGSQKVAEMKVEGFVDYQDILKSMDFYDMKNGKAKISRDYDIKWKTTRPQKVYDYITSCGWVTNSSGSFSVCEKIEDGFHWEDKEYWEKLTPADLKKNEVMIIGVFTDVQLGDYVDWVPEFFGVKVEEWATWTADLNTNIVAYYKLDNNDLTDSAGSNDATNSGSTNTSGIILSARNFILGSSQNIVVPDDNSLDFGTGDFTVNWWYKTSITNNRIWGKHDASTTYNGLGCITGIQPSPVHCYIDGTGSGQAMGTTAVDDGVWHMITLKRESGNFSGWVDGVYEISYTETANIDTTAPLYIGYHSWWAGYGTNSVDEFAMWKGRGLSKTDIEQIYDAQKDGFITGQYTEDFDKAPTVTQVEPDDNELFLSTSLEVNFTCYGSDDINFTLMEFYFDEVLTGTNSSGLNNTNYSFSQTLSEGRYNWSCIGYDNNSLSTQTTTRLLIVHNTTPTINIFKPEGTLQFIKIGNNETLSYNITEEEENISEHFIECWFEYNNTEILNNITYNDDLVQWVYSNNYANVTEVTDGVNTITNIPETCSRRGNFTLRISDSGEIGFDWLCLNEVGTFQSMDILSSENIQAPNITALQKRPLNCIENSTSFKYILNKNSLCVHSIDEFGLHSQSVTTWDYKIIEINQTLNNITIEGNTQDISSLIKLESGLSISAAILNYNGTLSTGTSTTIGEITTLLKSDLITNRVESDQNITLFWSIVLSGGEIINLTQKNQTILNLGIDNCSSFSNKILNMTIVDEEDQTIISSGTTLEISLDIISKDKSITIENFSQKSEGVNPVNICTSQIISEDVEYSLDSIIRYTAAGYSNEYYNLVDTKLNNDTGTTSLILFSLNESDSTDFQLTFTGEDFLPVENALVSVGRQYISENAFKVVELPKTDSNGETILHLVRNDVIYNILVMKDGEVLGLFNNVIAFCEDFTIGACSLPLNAISNISLVFNYDDEIGLIFENEPQYNETTMITSFSFASTDGSTKVINIRIERDDIFGNRTICENTLVSSSGTISCQISQDISDTSLLVIISVDGEDKIFSTIIIDKTVYGQNGYAMLFIFAIAMVLLFSGDKTWTLIGLVLAYIFGVALGFMVGGIAGVGSTGIFVLIITVVGIWQLNKGKKQ